MFETEQLPKNEFRVEMPECAMGCGRQIEEGENLQTAKGKVCADCFRLEQMKALDMRDTFEYKWMKFKQKVKRFLGL